MKNFQTRLLQMVLILLPFGLQSQEIPFTLKYGGFTVKEKITILSADIQRLKTVKSFNAIMEIENMRIGNTKHEPDSVYIQRRVSELNAKGKSMGDEWLREWEDSKPNYLPVFIEGYNAKISRSRVPKIVIDESSAFTIVLRPDTITIGNKWMASFLSMHLYIVSSKNQTDTIASFKSFTVNNRDMSKQYPGSEESAFCMAGEMLAKYFKEYMYKSK